MTDYEFYKSIGICPKCKKQKPAPGRVMCFECLAKAAERTRKAYSLEKARMYYGRRKEIKEEHKKNGICIQCQKPAKYGVYCYEHYIKMRRDSSDRAYQRKLERHENGIRAYRKKNGLCMWCGEKALPNLQCCEKHQKILREKMQERSKEHIWYKKREAGFMAYKMTGKVTVY